jgi:hypothetical protein
VVASSVTSDWLVGCSCCCAFAIVAKLLEKGITTMITAIVSVVAIGIEANNLEPILICPEQD